MSDLGTATAVDAVTAAYETVTAAVDGLGEAEMMRPSLCAGWAVADVLCHLPLDARGAWNWSRAEPGRRPCGRCATSN